MMRVDLDKNHSWKCCFRTLYACGGAMMVFVYDGVVQGQTGVLFPQLQEKDSAIHLTPDEETWIGLESVGLVYLVELSVKEYRSLLLGATAAIYTVGILISNVVGGYLPWHLASGIFSLTAFGFGVVHFFAPESPAWLYKSGRRDSAVLSLQALGRSPASVRAELELLELSARTVSENVSVRVLLEPTVWKPLVIVSLLLVFQAFTGGYQINSYSEDIVQRLGTEYDPLHVSNIMSVATAVTNCTLGVYCISYMRRRPATITLSILVTLASLGAGIYELLLRGAPGPFDWLPIALLAANLSLGSVVTNISWILSGEVFPLRVRGSTTGAIFFVGWGSQSLAIKLYYASLAALRVSGLCFAYAAGSLCTVLLAVFALPETHNKTLYEVEQSFKRRESKDAETPVQDESNL
ncbi:unnamed protein product [Bemisia tabaci]|uniref:Sugar transporter n=1 Tax=Bemisia tabaci TaxID=7038 RepID=A0A9P0F080_BEMTA|nr:unnamed protein product [Bemisia tabaci]